MSDALPEAVIEAMARGIDAWAFAEKERHLADCDYAAAATWDARCGSALHTARLALEGALKAGVVLVPVEATEEMVEAMRAIFVDSRADGWRDIYAAALAARPGAAPTKQEGEI